MSYEKVAPNMELEKKTQEWAKNTWVWILHENEPVACTVSKKDGDNWTIRLPNGSVTLLLIYSNYFLKH